MSEAQELSIGMFVVAKDKDFPIKGKIQVFTADGKAVVKDYLSDKEYTLSLKELQVINCMYSARMFTIDNDTQEFGEYPTEFQLWEDINTARDLYEESRPNTIVSIVVYVRQEYVPVWIDAEWIFDKDADHAWVEHDNSDYLIDVDDTHSEVLEQRLNSVYIDWLREYGYMPNCGDLLETKVYHLRDGFIVCSHTINHIKNIQETT